MPESALPEDRLAMINGIIGEVGIRDYYENATAIVSRLVGYQLALKTGAVCNSRTITGGCKRYPGHGDGHSAYPFPGDPGYYGSDAHKAAAAQARGRELSRQTSEYVQNLPTQQQRRDTTQQ